MIPEWAKVGAKVVCVGRAPDVKRFPTAEWPVFRSVYTVRDIVFHTNTGEALFLLCEVHNDPRIMPAPFNKLEPAFQVAAFRPLISRTQQQDADMFRELRGSLDPIIRADMLLDELGEA